MLKEHSSDPEDEDPVPNPVMKREFAHRASRALDMVGMQQSQQLLPLQWSLLRVRWACCLILQLLLWAV